MSPGIRRTVLVVMNRRAAEDDGLRAAIGKLRDDGTDLGVRVCWEDGDGRRWAREGAAAGAELIVAAGGDGTLNEVVNGLLDGPGDEALAQPPTVGLLPFGTANDFAGGLGIGRVDVLEGLERMLAQEALEVDLGRLDSGRWFVNVATGGFGAQVTSRTPTGMKRLLGGAAYLLSGLGEMSHMAAEPVRLRGPGWGWQGDAYLVAVGNGRRAGGGFRVCPDAEIRDGLLDVVVVPEVPEAELLRMLGGLLRTGGHLESEAVWTRRGTWLELETEREIQLNLDGEPVRGVSFRFEAVARRLPLVLPDVASGSMLGEPEEGAA